MSSSLKEMAPGGSPEAIVDEDRTKQGELHYAPPAGPDPEALIASFAAKWPKTFFLEEDLRRPLQRKIHLQIFNAFHDMDAIRIALAAYVNSLGYLLGMKYGAERIGLHGKPAGEVSAKEAEAARNRLADLERLHPANAEKPRLSLGRRA